MRLIGLTGGIGAGKSEVARVVAAAGIPVIDADDAANSLLRRGTAAFEEVVSEFGEGILDAGGEVDRQRLAAVVFDTPARLARLNAILHPRVIAEVRRRAAALSEMGHEVAMVEAALLVETGFHERLDGLVVVSALEAGRVGRVAARDGCPESRVTGRVAMQTSDAERERHADVVIRNDGTLDALRAEARRLAIHLVRGF